MAEYELQGHLCCKHSHSSSEWHPKNSLLHLKDLSYQHINGNKLYRQKLCNPCSFSILLKLQKTTNEILLVFLWPQTKLFIGHSWTEYACKIHKYENYNFLWNLYAFRKYNSNNKRYNSIIHELWLCFVRWHLVYSSAAMDYLAFTCSTLIYKMNHSRIQ